jgi:anthranilate phosphoribosyltransferase
VILEALQTASSGKNLTRDEADAAMEEILCGRATDAEIRGLLAALREKGETVEELVGLAMAMRRHAAPVFAEGRESSLAGLVDTCGTGGDAKGTFNISTCAAFVVAGAGARVAKHGNRSISSRAGSADVLEALGVRMDVPLMRMGEAVEQIGIGFFFAQAAHAAMRHAMRARRELKGFTAFNLLGPLTNPAGARAQIAGVFNARATELVAGALAELGVERAFVVHGADGLDEISLSGETRVAEVQKATVRRYTIAPEDFGLTRAPLEEIAGGDATENAAMIRAVLAGERGAKRDIVVANAAAALAAAGRAADFREGAERAAESMDTGAARQKLEELIAFVNWSA